MKNTTEIKNTIEGITGKKINKWAGRQSNRNYCHRTELHNTDNEIIIVSETSGTALSAPKFTW